MMTNNKKLAKTSSTPGKTQLINHFLINKEWYLVDLPGYGYAKASKKDRNTWTGFLSDYLQKRENLVCTFVLIDSRHEPQKIDLEFMYNLAVHQLPFVIIFTKIDKISKKQLIINIEIYFKEMLKTWASVPSHFTSSANSKSGKDEILEYIGELNNSEAANYIRDKK